MVLYVLGSSFLGICGPDRFLLEHKFHNNQHDQINGQRNNTIHFLRKGQAPTPGEKPQRTSVLGTASDWEVLADLKTRLVVPMEIAITTLWPDIVLWSRTGKAVVLCELTCPCNENGPTKGS